MTCFPKERGREQGRVVARSQVLTRAAQGPLFTHCGALGTLSTSLVLSFHVCEMGSIVPSTQRILWGLNEIASHTVSLLLSEETAG